MPVWPAIWTAALLQVALVAAATAEPCADPARALGVSRIVEIDAASGPLFGSISAAAHEPRFLAPKEVVLTFDDGPLPGVTRPILDTLDRFCTKATFFSVGQMALAYPALVREELARGHTVGTHTWSHPLSLRRLGFEKARDQIESGFAAVSLAAGRPIAPFFRFPGLSDTGVLLTHMQQRGIASFTVDVVSNDSFISDPERLIARTLQRVEAEKGGILLFHDIKHVTARALPTILSALKERGYRVVHMRSKSPFVPDARYIEAVSAHARKLQPSAQRPLLAITSGLTGGEAAAPSPVADAASAKADDALTVTKIAPLPRERHAKAPEQATDDGEVTLPKSGARVKARTSSRTAGASQSHTIRAAREPAATPVAAHGGWSSSFRRHMEDLGG